MKLQEGEQVEQFQLLNRLGNGGMSDVFRAFDATGQREVTLKFPHDDIMGDPATYERFQREVQIGQKLQHPHIQKLYALQGSRMSPFMVLEYVPGKSLRSVLAQGWRDDLPVHQRIATATDFGGQIAQALSYAHGMGVVHRDMKPENVLITPEGVAKIMDFGIAFIAGARRVTYGSLSSQVGTPDYMAPEQIKGQRGDFRTDIYALGMMLYEMLTGQMPYEGDNALAIMSQHVTTAAPPLSQVCEGIPPELEEVVLKAIRRDPANRWASMAEFATALAHPETTNTAQLRHEREEQEPGGSGNVLNAHTGAGPSPLQLALVIFGILATLLAVGVLAQLTHHP